MKDIPVIFSAPMVRALLDGRKTMTRRLAWVLPGKAGRRAKRQPNWPDGMWPSQWQNRVAGDRLWVKETWTRHASGVDYAADLHEASLAQAGPWRSPLHCSRAASRITLIVTGVKIERLDKISESDAKAEGAIYHDGGGVGHSGWRHDPAHGYVHRDARTSFACLWDRLHGEGSFNSCPEVVALTFTVHKQNIDALAQAA